MGYALMILFKWHSPKRVGEPNYFYRQESGYNPYGKEEQHLDDLYGPTEPPRPEPDEPEPDGNGDDGEGDGDDQD